MPQPGYQPIQLYRTTGAAAPAALLNGEPAVALGTTKRFWVGDGASIHLFLSSDGTELPLATAQYLLLAGGTMTGAIAQPNAPVNDNHLANKVYVDTLVSSLKLLRGLWDVAANTPDLAAVDPPPQQGHFFIARTADPHVPETAPAGIPGIAGETIGNGDAIYWNATTEEWERLRAPGLTMLEADARYVQLAGSTMTGALILHAAPTSDMMAATKKYVDDEITAHEVNVDGVSIAGDGTAASPLYVAKVDGGVF